MSDPVNPYEQPALLDFDTLRASAGTQSATDSRQRSQPSKAFAACPEHRFGELDKLTGLVAQGEHLVWRLHYVTTQTGATWACRASGIPVCELPPRIPAGVAADCRHPFTRKGAV